MEPDCFRGFDRHDLARLCIVRLKHGIKNTLHKCDLVGGMGCCELSLHIRYGVHQGVNANIVRARHGCLRVCRTYFVAELFDHVVHSMDIAVEIFDRNIVGED